MPNKHALARVQPTRTEEAIKSGRTASAVVGIKHFVCLFASEVCQIELRTHGHDDIVDKHETLNSLSRLASGGAWGSGRQWRSVFNKARRHLRFLRSWVACAPATIQCLAFSAPTTTDESNAHISLTNSFSHGLAHIVRNPSPPLSDAWTGALNCGFTMQGV
jgi:hypothetical protein